MLLQVPYVPGRSYHHLAFEPARPDLVLPGAKAGVLVGFELPLPIAKVFLGHLETLAEAAGVVYRFVVSGAARNDTNSGGAGRSQRSRFLAPMGGDR